MELPTIIWWSAGVTSAVMTKIALNKFSDCVIVFIVTGSEEADTFRFLRDCEKWYNHKIEVMRNSHFENHIDVCRTKRFLNSPTGAPCTFQLKKMVRYEYEKQIGDWERQCFGFDFSEVQRALRFSEQNPVARMCAPLIEAGLTKENCLAILQQNHIEIPKMYRLGFHNNNCVGCVKGGKGYWALIRKCFPTRFEQMMKLEREIGHSCIKGCFLDELPKDYPTKHPIVPSCNLWCDIEFLNLI